MAQTQFTEEVLKKERAKAEQDKGKIAELEAQLASLASASGSSSEEERRPRESVRRSLSSSSFSDLSAVC